MSSNPMNLEDRVRRLELQLWDQPYQKGLIHTLKGLPTEPGLIHRFETVDREFTEMKEAKAELRKCIRDWIKWSMIGGPPFLFGVVSNLWDWLKGM